MNSTHTLCEILFSLLLGSAVSTRREDGTLTPPGEKWLDNTISFVDDSYKEHNIYRITLTLFIEKRFSPQDLLLSVFSADNVSVSVRYALRETSGIHADVHVECDDKQEDAVVRFQTPNMSGTMGYNITERIVIQPI